MNNKSTHEYDRELVNRTMMSSLKKEGYEGGYSAGKQQEKIEIAKKMLSKNTNIDFIVECTGLTIEEINNLKV